MHRPPAARVGHDLCASSTLLTCFGRRQPGVAHQGDRRRRRRPGVDLVVGRHFQADAGQPRRRSGRPRPEPGGRAAAAVLRRRQPVRQRLLDLHQLQFAVGRRRDGRPRGGRRRRRRRRGGPGLAGRAAEGRSSVSRDARG